MDNTTNTSSDKTPDAIEETVEPEPKRYKIQKIQRTVSEWLDENGEKCQISSNISEEDGVKFDMSIKWPNGTVSYVPSITEEEQIEMEKGFESMMEKTRDEIKKHREGTIKMIERQTKSHQKLRIRIPSPDVIIREDNTRIDVHAPPMFTSFDAPPNPFGTIGSNVKFGELSGSLPPIGQGLSGAFPEHRL